MDRLAACHVMYGFLHVPSGRGRHPNAPNCQNVKRSLSLTDRRGIISPGRGNGRGLISPLPVGARGAKGTAEEWEGMSRQGTQMMKKVRDLGILMQAMDPTLRRTGSLLPDFSGKNKRWQRRSYYFGGSRYQQADHGEYFGELLLSLRYSPANSQLSVGVLRASGVRVPAPFITVWLLREGQKPEKRSTGVSLLSSGGDSARRCSLAPPVFQEGFNFDVLPGELQSVIIVASVMNCGSAMESSAVDVEIGHVVLGELGGDDPRSRHWRETIGRPEKAITQWHRIEVEY